MSLVSGCVLQGHSQAVKSVCFSPSGKFLASGGKDKTIKIWHLTKRQSISLPGKASGSINSIAYPKTLAANQSSRILASGGEDKTVRLWSLETRQEICTVTGHDRAVNSVAFHPNSKILASGSDDETIYPLVG